MTSRNVLSKAVAGVVVAGALSLTSLFTGAVSAHTGIQIGVGELQEYTISKSVQIADGDTDGRDFLVWQSCHAEPAGQPICYLRYEISR